MRCYSVIFMRGYRMMARRQGELEGIAMPKPMPVVLQLQADAINPTIPVATTLRLAKVIATKLDQNAALHWNRDAAARQ